VPNVHTESAPKNDGVADNALITAAAAAADRTNASEAATATTATAAPPAPTPPPPAEQLAAVIRPLPKSPDGSYQIKIEMRPPELGRVDMRVEMRDGVVHASIHTERSDTADLVRSALDDLRSRLDSDGLRSGQFTVDSQGAGTSGRGDQSANPDRVDDTAAGATEAPAVAPTTTTASNSLLDVRI